MPREAGVRARFVDYGSWAAAQAAVRDGKADAILGIYRNDERATAMAYVEPPFATDPVAVLARKGAGFKFADRDSLVGRKGVTNEGESYGTAFDAFMAAKLDVTRAPGAQAAFAALLGGKADYMIVGRYPGMAEAVREGIGDKVEVVTGELLSEPMYVAFSRKSPCLALAKGFGEGIEAARKDGTIARLVRAAERRWAKLNAPAKAEAAKAN